MTLTAHQSGTGNTRVSYLHGFTQTAYSWNPVLALLDQFDNVALDAPNHGDSQHVTLNLTQTAQQLSEQCANSFLVGYSMGARMALHTAIAHPQSCLGFVFISGTPGLELDHDRQLRRESDDLLAQHIEAIGTESFIHEWLEQPMFRDSTFEASDRSDRLRNAPESLANSLRTCGTGQQQSLWNELEKITVPVLLIAGERDTKFCDIATTMATKISHSTLHIIPQAGHAAHLDQPKEFVRLLTTWLNSNTDSKQ